MMATIYKNIYSDMKEDNEREYLALKALHEKYDQLDQMKYEDNPENLKQSRWFNTQEWD